MPGVEVVEGELLDVGEGGGVPTPPLPVATGAMDADQALLSWREGTVVGMVRLDRGHYKQFDKAEAPSSMWNTPGGTHAGERRRRVIRPAATTSPQRSTPDGSGTTTISKETGPM